MDGEIKLGFLGLGQTGGAMAERLLGKGVRLHVFDAGPGGMMTVSRDGRDVWKIARGNEMQAT